jgi:hypothetical protein
VTSEINLTTTKSNLVYLCIGKKIFLPRRSTELSLPLVNIFQATRNHVPVQSRLHLSELLFVSSNGRCINCTYYLLPNWTWERWFILNTSVLESCVIKSFLTDISEKYMHITFIYYNPLLCCWWRRHTRLKLWYLLTRHQTYDWKGDCNYMSTRNGHICHIVSKRSAVCDTDCLIIRRTRVVRAPEIRLPDRLSVCAYIV